jgi:hypothetical protein
MASIAAVPACHVAKESVIIGYGPWVALFDLLIYETC